jgi:hypothetical protein
MRDAAALAPAAKAGQLGASNNNPAALSANRECLLWNGHCKVFSGELSRQIRKEERSNAIFVAAFFLIQHPGIISAH